MRLKNEVGNKYGRLLVLAREGSTADGKAAWLCECSCGSLTTVSGHKLRNKHTTSCGCLRRDFPPRWKHGAQCNGNELPEYNSWQNIKARCLNPQNPAFKNYGGRGIKIAKEWKTNFAAFLDHVGRKPGPGYSIDRIENDGSYEPGNVRWATYSQQSLNRRSSKINRDNHGGIHV